MVVPSSVLTIHRSSVALRSMDRTRERRCTATPTAASDIVEVVDQCLPATVEVLDPTAERELQLHERRTRVERTGIIDVGGQAHQRQQDRSASEDSPRPPDPVRDAAPGRR